MQCFRQRREIADHVAAEFTSGKRGQLLAGDPEKTGQETRRSPSPTEAPSQQGNAARDQRQEPEAKTDAKQSSPSSKTANKDDGRDDRNAVDDTPKQKNKGQREHKGGQEKDAATTAAAAAEDESKNDYLLVEAQGRHDQLDPHNWPLTTRAHNIAVVALLIFCQAWAGGAESMANPAASKEFGVSPVAESLSTAMYLFGIGTGALFAGPASETYGRTLAYIVPTFCYLFFVLGAALTPTFGGQVVCRYFVGLFSSATMSINGSSVRDQFHLIRRSFVFPLIAWANVVAPVLASLASGFIVSNPKLGWRWTEWITLILSSFAWLVTVLFLPETHLPRLLAWKAAALRRETGDQRYRAKKPDHEGTWDKAKKVALLPATFFFTEPVITVLGSYLVLLYVLLFTFLSGFAFVFQDTYHLSASHTSACFGSIAAGATLFATCAPLFYSAARRRVERSRGAPVEPEFRLWPAMVTSPLLPVLLFWLGWTNAERISIWSGLGACFLFGVVLIALYVSSYEYIVDSYGDHAASALASVTMVRYLIAGGMVVAARPMYEGIGVQYTLTLLGCIATVLAPAPLLFWRFGQKLRQRSPYAKTS